MGCPQEPEINVQAVEEPEEANSSDHFISQLPTPRKNRKWWLRMVVYILFILFGQSGATLLGRLYYDKGGKSIWLATLVTTLGFPILIPFSLYYSPPRDSSNYNNPTNKPPSFILATVYVVLGLIQALDNILYSIGLLYLPVSTYSLISATQLAFNTFFSFFLNAQKLTPLIVNSIVLLTISSTLLVLQSGSEHPKTTSRKYWIGFSCTVIASLLYSLLLSLTQLFFHKVLRRENFQAVLDLIIYQSLIATCVSAAALFASNEWNGLKDEMEKFDLGKVTYVMLLVGIIVGWQVFSIGEVGLIFEVSSLFSNVISTLALPTVPILAVIFFHDKMDGVKVIAMALAVWGFASYIYQHYIDDSRSPTDRRNVNEVSELPAPGRC